MAKRLGAKNAKRFVKTAKETQNGKTKKRNKASDSVSQKAKLKKAYRMA